MAIATECQTPGTVIQTRIHGNVVSIHVSLPNDVAAHDAGLLDANIHNALELVFAALTLASC